MDSDNDDLLIGTKDLADMFHVRVGAPPVWRKRNTGPPYTWVRGECKYSIKDIKAWIASVDTKRGRYLLEDVENWLAKQAANSISAGGYE